MTIVLLCGFALAVRSDAAHPPPVPPVTVASSFDAPAELAGLPLVTDPDKNTEPPAWLKWLKRTISTPTDTLAVTYTDQSVHSDVVEIADVIEIAAVAGPVSEPAAAMVGSTSTFPSLSRVCACRTRLAQAWTCFTTISTRSSHRVCT